MSARDLCTTEDVLAYIPGYVSNTTTDGLFADLITAESDAIHDQTGREIIAVGDQPATRLFAITPDIARIAKLDIGDLSSAGDTDITVEVLAGDGATIAATIDRDSYRPLYENRLNQKAPWEPITGLEFPVGMGAARFTCGQTLLVTGTFGFPEVPAFIRQACAKRVILRYATDVAQAGTQAAAAIAEINLAGLFASARDDVERLSRMVMIA